MLRLVIVGSLALSAHAGRATSASARAQQWMKAHADPNDQAGMNDLRSSDPNAFAIVQALLAKQQLGLLDPKHPTANFAGARPHEDRENPGESAADVLRSAPTIDGAGVPQSLAAVSAPEPARRTYSSSNMWNFKPHAGDDDALVASVMGDVTGNSAPVEYSAKASTGSLISSNRATGQSSALNGDLSTFGFGGSNSMAIAASQEVTRPAPVVHHSTAAFGGMPTLEWGNRYAGTAPTEPAAPVAAPVTASMSQQTSSLASVAQPAPQPAPVQVQAANPYLNGIDFSGDVSKKASMSQQKQKVHKVPTAAELVNNPYLEGIDFGQPQAAQPVYQPAPVQASMSQKASYLDAIDFPMAPRRRVQPEAPMPREQQNALTGFSWHGEDQIAAAAPMPVETNMMQKVEEGVTAAKINGPLSDWLTISDGSSKQAANPITAELQESSPTGPNVDPMAMDKYNDWVKYSN